MTSLPRQLARRRSSAPRARPREGPGACQVDDRLARLGTLPGVDRRHHGDRGTLPGTWRHDDRLARRQLARRRSSARARPRGGPGACQVDDRLADARRQLALGTGRRRSSAPRGPRHVARSMTAWDCPPSIIGTTGGTMTSLPASASRRRSSAPRGPRHDDQLARSTLPAVDRRHGHGRGKAPALARSMTALPAVGTLPGVDRRHHGDRGTLPGR